MRTNFLSRLCHAEQPKDACSRFRKQAASEWRGQSGQSMKSQSYKRHLGSLHLPRGPTTPGQFACFLFLPSLVTHLFTAIYHFHKAYHSLLCTCAHPFCVGHSGNYPGCSREYARQMSLAFFFSGERQTGRQTDTGYSNSTSYLPWQKWEAPWDT